MKKYFTLCAVMLFTVASWAQSTDYLLKKDFQSEKKKISDGIDAAKKSGFDAKKIATKQLVLIDSLTKIISANGQALVLTNDSLQKTEARFNDLESRVMTNSSQARNLLLVAVIVIAILFVLFLALIFFLKGKSDEKIRELSEENMKLGESVKQDFVMMKAEQKKTGEELSLKLHESTANLAAKIEQSEEGQENFAREIKALADRIATEQAKQKSMMDEQLKEFLTKANTEKAEHRSLHEKIESEFKGLQTRHAKDLEEIKAKR